MDGRGRKGGDAAVPLDDLRQPHAVLPAVLGLAQVERGVDDQVDIAADHPGGHVRGPGDGERVQQLRAGFVRRIIDGHGHTLGLGRVDRKRLIDAGRRDVRRVEDQWPDQGFLPADHQHPVSIYEKPHRGVVEGQAGQHLGLLRGVGGQDIDLAAGSHIEITPVTLDDVRLVDPRHLVVGDGIIGGRKRTRDAGTGGRERCG